MIRTARVEFKSTLCIALAGAVVRLGLGFIGLFFLDKIVLGCLLPHAGSDE